MRKFQFKFASILKLRKSREEDALAVLGRAQQAYQVELNRRNALTKELDDALLRREKLADQPVDIRVFLLEQDFITGTKQRLIQQGQAITRASRTVEKALRNYLLLRRQTRMIEILREKAYAEHRRDEAKREQRRLDDLSVMRARFKEEIA